MKKITLPLLLSCLAWVCNAQDTCSNALIITAGTYTVAQVNGSQVPGPVCMTSGSNQVTAGEWYTYTANQDHSVIVSTSLSQNSGGDTRIHVYSGTCGSLSCIAGDDDSGDGFLSEVTFEAYAGQTYYIAFDDYWSNVGFDFQLTESEPQGTAPITFENQALSTNGTFRAVVDMNADFLDDIVSVTATNINIHHQNVGGGFTSTNITTTQADYTPGWSMAAGDFDGNGYNDLLYGSGSGVTFMKANEDGTSFTEISSSNYVFSQRSNFIDINNDGHLDAFVCHDVAPNVYYINDGSGNLVFHQGEDVNGVPNGLGIYPSGGNYGSIWVDYDNDHDLDMFIAKCGGEVARRTNQMHRNEGDGNFTEVGADIGLADPMQTWSSAWGDFDNDGDMDVFVGASSGTHKLMENDGNGNFIEVTAGSGIETLTATGIENVTYDFDNDGNLDIYSNGNILVGNGDLTFNVYENVLNSNNGAFGDLNNDGFIDCFSSNTIYMNNGNDNNWITINTIGTLSNKNGIGARIELYTAGGTQIRDVRSGDGFRYMSTLNTHFGLGSQTAITNIVVYWPSGTVDNILNPSINSVLTITEGQTLSVEDRELSQVTVYPNPASETLFINSTKNLSGKVASVFDIRGKRVLNLKLSDNKLDVSNLQSGIYLLRLEEKGKSHIQKFVKQ
ncbi:FG-GAP-like repeat-containing protein [Mangrovimonas aestuarii]|uniref:FG-GAP-like repeat-containing protein n=1 Tax=Mangrovimonas aestuarii TaxID=3018443 RepID=UPI0023797486|nr:FG-GAP-like repeat-containing protein [Mangrovimonas aestuarii]